LGEKGVRELLPLFKNNYVQNDNENSKVKFLCNMKTLLSPKDYFSEGNQQKT